MTNEKKHAAEGIVLASWKEYRGFTNERLAEALGWSTSTLGRILRGKKKANAEQLAQLMEILDFTRDQFEINVAVLQGKSLPQSALDKVEARVYMIIRRRGSEQSQTIPFTEADIELRLAFGNASPHRREGTQDAE